jgi:hypothetical protein
MVAQDARTAARGPRPSVGGNLAVGAIVGFLLFAVFVVAWIWWETEGAWRSVPALGVEVGGDDLAVGVLVGCIEGEIRASVAGQSDRVLVMVEIRGERSGNDCMHGVQVTMPERLAGRELVDWQTGDPIPTD